MTTTCVSLPRAINAMKSFLYAASDLPDRIYISQMGKYESGFACKIFYFDTPHWFDMQFYYDRALKTSPYYSDEYTRFAHKERSYARGFAGVTLCLLHELGHYHTTRQIFAANPDYNRQKAVNEIINQMHKMPSEKIAMEEGNRLYQQLPDEKAAADWALDWLADTENRKIAKAFEKKFFACYQKALDKWKKL